jgi:hypothetical protein
MQANKYLIDVANYGFIGEFSFYINHKHDY